MTQASAESIRCFVAVPIPSEVKTRVGEVQRRLMSTGADYKWVDPETFHITVRFLGERNKSEIERIRTGLLKAGLQVRPFGIVVTGIGAFPDLMNPRVFWVGVDEEGKRLLGALFLAVEKAINQYGFGFSDKPFSPHLTLGRQRSRYNSGHLRKLLDNEPGLLKQEFGHVSVEEIALVKSTLTPRGPVYEMIDRFVLGSDGRR